MTQNPLEQTLNRWLISHQAIVYKLVRVYAKTSHDQDDLFQEISFQLWRSIPQYRGEAKESTYVYQVALFAALAWSRKRASRIREVPTEPPQVEQQLFQPTVDEDPRVEWLYQQISRFDPVDRSLVLLHLDGYGHAEISNLIGIGASNVGTRLARLKKKLTENKPPKEFT